jgi:hypothetical protein
LYQNKTVFSIAAARKCEIYSNLIYSGKILPQTAKKIKE